MFEKVLIELLLCELKSMRSKCIMQKFLFSIWASLPTCLAIFLLWLCLLETNVWLLFIEAEKPVELSIYRVSSEKFNPDASLRHFDLLIQFTHQYISTQITRANTTM